MSVTACLSLLRSHTNVLVFVSAKHPPAPPAETRCMAGIHVRPSRQALPKETKEGRHNSRTRQRARTDSHYPAALGLSVCRTWCRDGLTAVVRAYPRNSSHQVVVQEDDPACNSGSTHQQRAGHGPARQSINGQKTCQAASGAEQTTRGHVRPDGMNGGKWQCSCRCTTRKYSRGSIDSPSSPPWRVGLKSSAPPPWGRGAGLATGV